jgi:hypothetical protein
MNANARRVTRATTMSQSDAWWAMSDECDERWVCWVLSDSESEMYWHVRMCDVMSEGNVWWGWASAEDEWWARYHAIYHVIPIRKDEWVPESDEWANDEWMRLSNLNLNGQSEAPRSAGRDSRAVGDSRVSRQTEGDSRQRDSSKRLWYVFF